MSAAPPTLNLRRAVVAHLKSDSVVTALVPAGSIYGESPPDDVTWPFVRYGVTDAIGTDTSIPLHVFSKGKFTDQVHRIVEAIGTSLDSATLILADGRTAHLRLAGTRVIPDAAEQSAWHGIATINAEVARDCAEA